MEITHQPHQYSNTRMMADIFTVTLQSLYWVCGHLSFFTFLVPSYLPIPCQYSIIIISTIIIFFLGMPHLFDILISMRHMRWSFLDSISINIHLCTHPSIHWGYSCPLKLPPLLIFWKLVTVLIRSIQTHICTSKLQKLEQVWNWVFVFQVLHTSSFIIIIIIYGGWGGFWVLDTVTCRALKACDMHVVF